MILLRTILKFPVIPLQNTKNIYNFGMLTDKLTEKQTKKAEDDFKKQIQHMANKPSFSLMDYRQRIVDELNNLKGSFRKNLSKDAQQMQKNLQTQKKVVNCLFEDELIGDAKVDFLVRKQIALVTGVELQKVNSVFQKARNYIKMHKYLRAMNRAGQQLPETMNELQFKFQRSRYAYSGKQRRHMKFKVEGERCKGSYRSMRIRYMKNKKN